MYRVADSERCVLQLDGPAHTKSTDSIYQELSVQTTSAAASQKSRNRARKSPSIPPTETDPPDVVLHSDGCAIALHLSVLQDRCPLLYKKLRQLRHQFETKTETFTLKVLEDEELRQLKDNREDITKCPLRDTQSLRLDYVRCEAHKCRGGQNDKENSPLIVQKRKRLRQDPDAVTDENQPPSGQFVRKSRRARSLFSDVDVWSLIDPDNLDGEDSKLEKLEHRGVMHVKIQGTNIGAIVTVVEYIYRFKVRMIDEHNALEAVRLGLWMNMRCTMLYYSLVLAIRHVTSKTWMEMLWVASTLSDKTMRRLLCDRLVDYLKALKPEQYYDALTNMQSLYVSRLKHHDILVRAVVGLINSVRLLEFWRNLLNALSKWLSNRFQTSDPPSLRAMHYHFAPDWKPYMEREPVELEVKAGEGNLFTLLQFGKFQLQVRIDITDTIPILWRIIRSSSPQVLTSDPDTLDNLAVFNSQPQFWIRGQMKVKYWRAQPNQAEVSQEVMIEYQHCPEQYSQWFDLVPASPSTLAPVFQAAAIQPEGIGKAQLRGKFFIWGDPVCSMYHFLLHTTLFYSAPHGASTELSDLMVVSEMQRLPLETLVLVLRSDRLRIPEGERTLLRCLNKLVFGKSFSYLGHSNQLAHEYNGRAKDVIRLYKCVRWCFVPLDDIIGTLRRSPRELKFYELIEKGLQDTFRRFRRRLPWGWRKYRHAYMKNETNVVEFRIEAGENQLSPEYFPTISSQKSSSHDSCILRPDPVYSDPPGEDMP